MTYYDILGVSRQAAGSEIRSAYRRLVKQHHPDLLRQAAPEVQELSEERLKAINEAYTTLIDPKKRETYHRLMWTRKDPALKYRRLFPDQVSSRVPGVNGRQPRRGDSLDEKIAVTILKLQSLRWERQHLAHRQELKRRRFWLSIGFSSLVVFTIMWMEYLTLSSASYHPTTQFLVFLITFISCELIAVPIVINTSAMRLKNHPLLGNPIVFSISVFIGSTMACVSLFGPRAIGSPSSISVLTGGVVLSLSMLTHLFIATQLGRVQEQIFRIEHHSLFRRVRDLEKQLASLRQKKSAARQKTGR